MSRYRQLFGRDPRLFVVIHVNHLAQVLHNMDLAIEHGADGIFLIDMRLAGREQIEYYYRAIRMEQPGIWVGLNYLSIPPRDAIDLAPFGVNAIWSDFGDNPMIATETLFFGGLAFKGQPQPDDLDAVAGRARTYMDVITTSGSATGRPPETSKIARIRAAIDDHPLAIASGISPENVRSYRRWADAFLVASSITDPESEMIIPQRLAALVAAVREPL
jgi:hypothetical protein